MNIEDETKEQAPAYRASRYDVHQTLKNIKSDVALQSLQQQLALMHPADRIFLIPLVERYTNESLRQSGLNALKQEHREIANAIKSAAPHWRIMMVQATNVYSTFQRGYIINDDDSFSVDDSDSDQSSQETPPANHNSREIIMFFDLQGNDVSEEMEWLEDSICFAPIEQAKTARPFDEIMDPVDLTCDHHRKTGMCDPMMLTDSKMTRDIWGDVVVITGEYGDRVGSELTSSYQTTFLLAYDVNSEFELQCISYIRPITAVVNHDIIPNSEFDLLDRLLNVAEVKPRCQIPPEETDDLLQLIMEREDQSPATVVLINKVLLTSYAYEPDTRLWDTIITLVEQYGWIYIGEAVEHLLCDVERKQHHSSHCDCEQQDEICPKSRISLDVFLNRVQFLLNLKLRFGEDEGVCTFADKCISECLLDMRESDNKYYYDGIHATIEKMVAQHGWIDEVIDLSLAFLMYEIKDVDFNGLQDLGCLLLNLHVLNVCEVTFEYLKAFAKVFSQRCREACAKLPTPSSKFLRCTKAVIDHGTHQEMNLVGDAFISIRLVSRALLTSLAEGTNADIDSQVFLRDILNRCLVQQPILSSIFTGESSPSPPHIKVVFEACPNNLATLADDCGRLPLHYAVDRKETPYKTMEYILEKNRAAASVPDPITGFFPFMMAAIKGNVAATHRLLLEDPELAGSGL